MKRTNKKGGAAIVAVLIVIMLVAVGSAALVVTGRYTIQASKVADAVVKVNSKPEESSSEEVSEVDDLFISCGRACEQLSCEVCKLSGYKYKGYDSKLSYTC